MEASPAQRLFDLLQISAGNPVLFQRLAKCAKLFQVEPVDSPGWTKRHGVQSVDWESIATQTTWTHFNFRNIQDSHTFWEEKTSLQEVRSMLEKVLDTMAATGSLPATGSTVTAKAANGQVVELRLETGATGLRVTRFHPIARPGNVTLNKDELLAIRKVLGG